MTLILDSSPRRILLITILAMLTWQGSLAQNYCRPSLGSCCEWISNVTIGSINHNTINESGYADYTNISTIVTKGATYPVSIKVSTNSIYVEHVKIYFDWDRDHIFESFVYLGSAKFSGQKVFTGDITVPPTAANGCSLMRVFMQYAQQPAGACTSEGDGEVEDYTLIVGNTSTPVADFTVSPSSSCNLSPLTFTNSSTISDGSILNYLWNFGDGTNSVAANPIKSYTSPGTYNVKLTTSTFCTSHSVTKSIVVKAFPSITSQPVNATICTGASTTFNVTSSGSGATHQWQVNQGSGFSDVINGGAYSNATSNTLNVTGAIANMNGYQYRCLITSSCTTTSSTAILTIAPGPTITLNPTNTSVCLGGMTVYTIEATGSGLTYRWQENSGSGFTDLGNGGPYSNVTTRSLTVSGVTEALHNRQYRCVVMGTCPSISSLASLTIDKAPLLTLQPANTAVLAGSNTSFSINALGIGLTYQWQENSGLGFVNLLNTSAYSNVTTATLNINASPISKNGYLYRCVVSGTCPPVITSTSAVLTVNSPYPVITSSEIKNVDEDILYHYTLIATNASGNPLTYSAPVKPAWLSFNSNTHVLSGIPANSEVGVHNVILRVSNGLLHTDQTFTITVKNQNDAPTILSSARTTINENEVYSYTFSASDIDANSTLTYSAPIIPAWLTFNQVSGILNGIPSHQDLGSHPITLRVSDGTISVDQNYNIVVVDVTRPTVMLSTVPDILINKPFSVIVDFSEAVADFAISDVTLVNGVGSLFNKISNSKFSFLVTPARDGEVGIWIASNVADDRSGNGNQAAVELIRQYDGTPPLVTLSTDALNPTAKPFTVTFVFSEKVIGFTSQDIVATNAGVSNFLNNGPIYSALITPSASGIVSVNIEENTLTDLAGNSNNASPTLEQIYDNVAPTGYEIQFGVDMVNVNNVENILFNVRKAETNTYFFYSIASNTNATVKKGTGSVQTETFTVSELDLTELGDGDLTLTFYLVDDAGNKGADVITRIEKITRNIISVTQQDTIQVSIHTPFTQITIPDSLEVMYSNNQKQFIAVSWNFSYYNTDSEGIYMLPGELKLAPLTTNLDHIQAEIAVVVTNDISSPKVFLSNTTFKSSIPSTEAIGVFTTSDENETAHIYQLVSGEGDVNNNLFEIDANKLYLKSNVGLWDFKQFSIRVKSINAKGNSIEEVFLLEKYDPEVSTLAVKIPNTFSPDGDGINDSWIIKDLKDFTDVSIQVFDRSGVPLYSSIDPSHGWDGSVPGGEILEGPFFYIVRIKDVVKKGVLIVIR